MYNDWLTIGPITIHGYGFMIALGILVGFWVMERQARKYGLNESIADNIVYVALVVGYLCSKLTYTIINFNDFLKDPKKNLFPVEDNNQFLIQCLKNPDYNFIDGLGDELLFTKFKFGMDCAKLFPKFIF